MESTGALIPQRHGGALRNGGTNKGGTGRPPNVLRAGMREKLPVELKKLQANVRRLEKMIADTTKSYELERLIKARQALVEFLAKYGMGTTFTETDDEGKSVRKPFTFTIATPN